MEARREAAMEFWNVIGFVDSHGAVHLRKGRLGEHLYHADFWPMQAHKLWRFQVNEWQLEDSILSREPLNEEEADAVIRAIRREVRPPEWVLDNEAREAK